MSYAVFTITVIDEEEGPVLALIIATGKCSLETIYIHIYCIYSDHVGESEAKTGIMERKSRSDNLSQSFSIICSSR